MGRQLLLFLLVLSLVQTSWQVNHNDISAERVKRSDDVNLQAIVEQQAAALQVVQAQVQVLQAQQAASQSELTNAKVQIASLQSKVTTLSKPVAFTVRFSADDAVHGLPIHNNEPLRFDVIILNTGNAYDVQTGMFTAPVPGTYCFFVTVMGVGSEPSYVAITKNGAAVDAVYAGTHEDEGSSLVTVHLALGDRVWIRHQSGVSVRGDWWTIFTGYLLVADA